jgi:very-short-patch-repair endonuclease
MFLDMAKHLGFHRSVLFGIQLCSSDSSGSLPLTSSKQLLRFLKQARSAHGCSAAMKAAVYVADNSWSIMESLLYMLLVLPNRHGGFGLKGAELNRSITLKGEKQPNTTTRFVGDLYWEKARLVVEYDSLAYHNNANSWIKDARRAAKLETQGYKVLSVNTAQLYNEQALAEVASAIARHLGRKIQIRTSRFAAQHELIRSMLPRCSPK